jgi:peptidoglycan/xylan/chitin deacetylase (PgdA/CDA1 family)
MRAGWLIPLLFLTACGEDEVPNFDDSEFGDSLDHADEGKADGYGVPASLGLDKRKILYLTFDDGPSPVNTPKVLDVLKKHGIQATFFLTGTNIAGNEALLRRERDEGHIVANHQWKHVQATLAQFDPWVKQEKTTIANVVGAMPLYFRYPFGAMTASKEVVLKANGYPHGGIGWDIDTLDWDFGPDATASRPEVPAAYKSDFAGWVVSQTEKRGGGVMLFHDIQSITATRLDGIITTLKARGFRFANLPRTATPAGKFIGDACTADAQCAFDQGFCLDGTCTRPCTGSCPDRAGYPLTRCVRAPDGAGASIDICLQSCGTCRAGLTCQALSSPTGISRSVCY